MAVAKAVNLGLALLVELAMLAALVVWAFHLPVPGWLRLVVAIAGVVAVGVVWGRFAAPTAAHRLAGRALLNFKIVVFVLGAVALLAAGFIGWTAIYALAVAVNLALAEHWDQ